MTMPMDHILLNLLVQLESIGEVHGELYDSEVREQMGNAIMEGFVRRRSGFLLPQKFGMISEATDARIREALAEYIKSANGLADEIGLTTFHARLAAFQNPTVRTSSAIVVDYDELFGHTPPEWYDKDGNVLWDRVR